VIARAGEEPLEVAEVAVDAAEIDPRTPSTMASSSSVSSSRQPQPFPAGSGLQAEQPQRRAGVALGPAEGERAADDLVPRGCDEHDRAVLGDAAGELDPAPVEVGDGRGELRAEQVERLGQLLKGRDWPDQVRDGGRTGRACAAWTWAADRARSCGSWPSGWVPPAR